MKVYALVIYDILKFDIRHLKNKLLSHKVYILPKLNIGNLSRNPHPKPISTVSNERIQKHTDATPPAPPCSALLRLQPITALVLPCCPASRPTFSSHTPLSSPFIRPSPNPPSSLILPTSPASALPPPCILDLPLAEELDRGLWVSGEFEVAWRVWEL